MPEAKSKFLEDIIAADDRGSGGNRAFTKERQHTAQAFTLHVEWRDGRHSEGFAWAHYMGYRWNDNGDNERLLLIFGSRALEIEGHNLGILIREIREGQLNSIRELSTAQQTLMRANPDEQPIISAVRSYPDFEEILKELKGEDEVETRHTKRLER